MTDEVLVMVKPVWVEKKQLHSASFRAENGEADGEGSMPEAQGWTRDMVALVRNRENGVGKAMTYYDYMITEEEFLDRDDFHELECSTQCGHYDDLNRCCWVSWRNQDEGDRCFYGFYEDESGTIVKVIWNKKEAEPIHQ